jgi:hypothetical protein
LPTSSYKQEIVAAVVPMSAAPTNINAGYMQTDQQAETAKDEQVRRKEQAITEASIRSVQPLCHARCCVTFLTALVMIRIAAWHFGNVLVGDM